MQLKYEKINKDNVIKATKLEVEIFPDSSAYSKYLNDIKDSDDLPINFLIYNGNTPIGVVGLYEIPEYADTVWLSWFGVKEEYRHQGFGTQILNDMKEKGKSYYKKFLRLFTYEVWNPLAQNLYKENMEIGEYYTNENDNQYNIKVGKCKIFGCSLCNEKIQSWNNKFINIDADMKVHEKSVELMKRDGLL